MLGVNLIMSSTRTPVNVTQLDFNINGTTVPSDVTMMKVWYTSSSNTFIAKYQFGNDIPYVPGMLSPTVPWGAGVDKRQQLLLDRL